MANKQQVLDLHRRHPDWTYQRIALEIGALPQYVCAVFRRNGIPIVRKKDPKILRARADALVAEADRIEAELSKEC